MERMLPEKYSFFLYLSLDSLLLLLCLKVLQEENGGDISERFVLDDRYHSLDFG